MTRLRTIIWRAVSTGAQMTEDKVSLEEQARLGQKWIQENNAELVADLVVPGLSRSESDIFDLFDEYASQGIYAYHDLRRLWKEKAFDVLWCYVDERLGRSTSLYSHSIENVIRSGAVIYSHMNGAWINEDNVETYLAIGGFTASMDIKKLKKRRVMGMRKRASRGLRVSSKMPFGFCEERDPNTGKAIRMYPDPAMSRFWEDVATLFLGGVGWHSLEEQLYLRYGHARKDGKPYRTLFIRSVFYSAAFWGHTAINYRNVRSPNGQRGSTWIFNEHEPPPEGVTMFRNTHPPIYTGETAERIKAEILRRREMWGKMRPGNTNDFSGLMVCAECGYYLVINFSTRSRHRSWYCGTILSSDLKRRPKCTQTRYMNERVVRAYFDRVLREMLASGTLGIFEPSSQVNYSARLKSAREDIEKTETKINRLMDAITTVDISNPAWSMYTTQIQQLGEQLQRQRAALQEDEYRASQVDTSDQYRAMDDLRALGGVDRLWEQPRPVVNQLLRRIVGNIRIAVLNAEFVGVVRAPTRQRGGARKNSTA